ncbi:hypothetical protein [Azospirillum rugosum]|uniref:Plasmid stability protein n=1 Tax=Azospirillum rugosum TaxID=416170 RepID=A0ABS4SD60_9PROT|nr:hypothetical protein [Azospirillum rugosum]MBP2290427.1 plasmid stability protein [Azospirillum rugosum]MDQ0527903.1 plasmid stability protein [Azospirillum rugosum]
MGKIVLENVEEDTLDRLRALASSTGRTPEEEAKRMIAGALGAPPVDMARRRELLEQMRRTAELTPTNFDVDLTQLIREDRDR